MKKPVKKIAFACALIIINTFLWFYFDVGSLLTIETIKHNREFLINYVKNNYIFSAMLYILAYTLNAALFLPATALLIMIGGLLFGAIAATCYAIIAATGGGTIAFLISRYFLGKTIQERYRHKLIDFNNQIQKHAVRYLLFVRLIPVFPFFLTNMLAGLTLIPIKTFIWTTALGIIPSVMIYTCIGQELTTLNSMRDILTPTFLLALLILTLLSILPLIVKSKK